MPDHHCRPLKRVAFLDAHVCRLSEVLGPPQICSYNEQILTGWCFDFPVGERRWSLSHLSDEPVANGSNCVREDGVPWAIGGETDDPATLHRLVRYLLEGDDFYHDDELVPGSDC